MSRTIQTTKANHQTADGNNETARPALEDPWELLSPWLMCGTDRCHPCVGKPKSFLDPTALWFLKDMKVLRTAFLHAYKPIVQSYYGNLM